MLSQFSAVTTRVAYCARDAVGYSETPVTVHIQQNKR
jgi:hypothetical protein